MHSFSILLTATRFNKVNMTHIEDFNVPRTNLYSFYIARCNIAYENLVAAVATMDNSFLTNKMA